MQECVSHWMTAYKRKSCQRGLQKMDADMRKTITPDDMNEDTVALGSAVVRKAAKLKSDSVSVSE